MRECLRKQLSWYHELELRAAEEKRRARLEGAKSPAEAPFPALVVISRGRPETVLEEYGCRQRRQGVYQAVRGLTLWVVVLTELPRTQDTLLLRLLGSGRVLHEALVDLAELPNDAWEKSIATPLLVQFRAARCGRRGRCRRHPPADPCQCPVKRTRRCPR